jgi:hypothetical protein
MERIELSQLSAGSIFKIGFFCLLGILLPLCVLFGLLALGGANTVSVNGRFVHGAGGLFAAIVMGFLFPAVLAGLMTLGGLVARLFGRMLPGLRLRGISRD